MVAIVLEPYSSEWPEMFAREKRCIESALDGLAIQVHHTGSTSVPGLRAKPIIDITLAVPDSTDEHAYLPALVDAGYELVLREPEWFEHRLFRGRDPKVNLHTYSADCEEIPRMLAFRDWLRTHPDDRELYEREKRRLAEQHWDTVQDYADAKTEVIREIVGRALAGDGTDVHGTDDGAGRP